MNNSYFFSVCIPTYNRGFRALKLVEKLLNESPETWNIVILNNGSDSEEEGYDKISMMAGNVSRLSYFRHSNNIEFHGNFLSCFEKAKTDFFMVLSDEDYVNVSVVEKMLKYAEKYSDIGLFRGSISSHDEGTVVENCITYQEQKFAAGKEALYGFSLNNNYPSGTIYNRRLVEEKGLLERLRSNIFSQQTYPHLYIDLLISSVSDVVTSEEVTCYVGESQPHEVHLNSDKIWINYVYSFGERINQFLVLRNAMFEAVSLLDDDFDVDMFVLMYIKLCNKYYYLISRVNMNEYINIYTLNPFYTQKAFYEVCCSAITLYSKYENMVPVVLEKLNELHADWEKTLQEDIDRMVGNA